MAKKRVEKIQGLSFGNNLIFIRIGKTTNEELDVAESL